MKTLLALILTATLTSAARPDQTDVMVVVLNDGGHRSLHHQTVSHDTCSILLESLSKVPVALTLRNPDAKGRVIDASCILPDGSMLHWPEENK
jgi:hypothetical protein